MAATGFRTRVIWEVERVSRKVVVPESDDEQYLSEIEEAPFYIR